VFDHLDDFRGEQAGFRAWVFTITHRLMIDERRRAARRPPPVELAAPVAESLVGGDAERDSLDHMAAKDVEIALGGLAQDQRDVLMLRLVADMTVVEVARVLGKRPGAVKALQRRGLERLRRTLMEVPT
jgi:RNA polymerase sigma factor (sigma-70 family)